MPTQALRLPSPKSLLHYTCFFCLVGWGASAIVVASHVGIRDPWFLWTRQLAYEFFFALLAFGFFYIQQTVVERIVGAELKFPLGYVQSLGCIALLLVDVSPLFVAALANSPRAGAVGLDNRLLFCICALGEAVFVANFCWSYLWSKGLPPARPAGSAARPAPLKSAQPWDWSSSPAAIFAIGAAFFLAGGLILISAAPTRVPIFTNGAISYVSPGYLWLPLAIPFAVFALIYWSIEFSTGCKFNRAATRIHFLCTVLAVIESIRIYGSWSSSIANAHPVLLASKDFFGVFALLALAAIALVWNIRTSSGRIPRPA